MAVLTAQGIARIAIPLLTRSIVLPRTVTMSPVSGFAPPNGETVTVRVRTPRTARTQASAGASITYDDQNEVAVPVTLSHLYDAYHVTDEDLTLTLENFAEQITAPQVASIATAAEDTIATAMNALSADGTIEFAASASAADTKSTILAARQALSEALVPAGDRWAAVSPSIATRVLEVEEFTKVNESGSASALRDAVIGRVFGFTFVESPALTDDTALFYHRSGIVMANKKPADPRGATESFALAADGFNIRQIFQYDPDVLSDASVLSTFAGASVVFEDESETEFDRVIKVGVGS
jgi:hypothetical protein